METSREGLRILNPGVGHGALTCRFLDSFFPPPVGAVILAFVLILFHHRGEHLHSITIPSTDEWPPTSGVSDLRTPGPR